MPGCAPIDQPLDSPARKCSQPAAAIIAALSGAHRFARQVNPKAAFLAHASVTASRSAVLAATPPAKHTRTHRCSRPPP